MAKKKTAKGSNPHMGLLEDWLKSLFKNFKPDVTKLNRVMFRAGVTQAFGAWKPTVTFPGDWDDNLIDMAADFVCDMVENAVNAAPDGDGDDIILRGIPKGGANAVEVEAADYTKADVKSYLEALGTSVPEDVRKKLERHPEVLASLKRLSRENQIKVLQSSKLMDWLIKYGPIILSLLMKILPFIL
jgi:hypothetical protein